MYTTISWSGGKDSTASVILAHENNIQLDEIIFAEVMYDHKRNISGEKPEHISFIYNVAIPTFKAWGYKVTVLRDKEDYLSLFYKQIGNRTKRPERIGKYMGYFLGGMCVGNGQLKMRPIRQYNKQLGEHKSIIGIAVDEPKRLSRLHNKPNTISLLEQYNINEQRALELCKSYNLLSPIYERSYRGGCWFCPNQSLKELASFKKQHYELWREFVSLGNSANLVSRAFKYTISIFDIDMQIDMINDQITIDEFLKTC